MRTRGHFPGFIRREKTMSQTIWTDELILGILQEDLGRRNPTEGTLSFLRILIESAKEEITAEGVALPEVITDPNDVRLIVSYAAWLYRKRNAAGEESEMPRALRWTLNQRAFGSREE